MSAVISEHQISKKISDPAYSKWVSKTFPALKGNVFLGSAGRGPMPITTVVAMEKLVKSWRMSITRDKTEDEITADFKKEASLLIGAQTNEVAFVPSTTFGINMFAGAVKWKRGDEIVICDVEYPANVFPWALAASQAGAKLVTVKSRNGIVDEKDIEKAITDKTRLVTMSHVQFGTGQKMQVDRVAEACEKHDAMLFLDSIQALGAVKFNVKKKNISGLCAGGYKWMLGPVGSGILYISKDMLTQMKPQCVSWTALDAEQRKEAWQKVVLGGYQAENHINLGKDIGVFEAANECMVQEKGLTESVKFLRSLGLGDIEGRIHDLNDHLLEQLDSKGFEVVTPRSRSRRAGIIAFCGKEKVHSMDVEAEILKELGNVKVAIRQGVFRTGVHFFNCKEDIDKAVSKLSNICQKRGLI